jgi:hypothetical protein
MERIYPQDASRALATVQRRDETSKEYDLERQQSVAQVGDTVPLAFTRFENNIGGLWLMGHLIRLGIKSRDISLLYLLSQGELGAVAADAIYYGGGKWQDLSSVSCQAYQAIPPCVDIVPGNVTWTQTITSDGTSLPRDAGEATFGSKSAYTTRFDLKISGECFVRANSSFVDANANYPANFQYSATQWFSYPPGVTSAQRTISENTAYGVSQGVPWVQYAAGSSGSYAYYHYTFQTEQILSNKAEVVIYSEVRYRYRVIRESSGATVREGYVWVGNGETALTIDGLAPAKYKVIFDSLYQERGWNPLVMYQPQQYHDPSWSGAADPLLSYTQNAYRAWGHRASILALNGTGRRNIAPGVGTLTQSFRIDGITETLQIDAGVQPSNTDAGLFNDLTLLGLKGNIDIVRIPGGVEYFKQVTAYVREGVKVQRLLDGDRVGSSHSFADLALYLLRKGIREEQIDIAALRLAAAFMSRYGMRYDGVLSTSQNLREWLGAVCPYFLCHVRQANGKIGIVPTLPVDGSGALLTGAVTPVLSFTQDDVAGYRRTYVPSSDRKAFCAVMVFSEQNAVRPGGTVTVEVRYIGQAPAGPFEQHDLSDFCLQRSHAELAARYVLARRRHVTHSIQFQTADKGRQLLPGDLIRVTMATLGDDYLYQVDAVEEGPDGVVSITAMHFPVDAQGRSLITLDLTSTSLEAR